MLGHYFRNIDEKNRVIVPSKFRSELGKVFYITLGPDKNLDMRDEKSFVTWKNKLLEINMLSKDAREFTRILLGNTIKVEFDKQGRITIPESFKLKSMITKEIAFVGVGNKIELWNKLAYDKFTNKYDGDDSLDELAKKLHNNGFEL